MSSLFGVNISGLIHENMSNGLKPATLVKRTEGNRTSGQLTGGVAITSTSYSARGFIQTTTNMMDEDGHTSNATDVTVMLIGDSIASLAVPEIGDRVTIEGVTYDIVQERHDPVRATYTLKCRVMV